MRFGIFIPGIWFFLNFGIFFPEDRGFLKILGFYPADRGFFQIWGFLSPGIGNFFKSEDFYPQDFLEMGIFRGLKLSFLGWGYPTKKPRLIIFLSGGNTPFIHITQILI